MKEIIVGGVSYGIRCDMNVIEAIEDTLGDIEEITKKRTVKITKFLAAEMINEHNYVCGNQERVTPEWVGAHMEANEYADVWRGVIECFIDCVTVKKK